MGIYGFLEHVMPREGRKVIALAQPLENGRVWFKYKDYDTVEQAARAAENFDARGETVYFAVNSFGDWYYCEKKKKKRIRTQENIVVCRSIYDDFDVDTKKDDAYDTRKEAFDAVVALAQAVRLTPTIVSSGGGFHAYFTLEEDVDVEVWEELSALKRDITNHLGLKADRSCDMDSARILRPVGTHNRKKDEARPVELIKQGKTYSVEKVREALTAYVRENNVVPAPIAKKHTGVANPFAAAMGDYPDSYADIVAENCAAVREFKESVGNIMEPHWWMGIGIVKHCVDGEEKIHEWSQGYEGYSQIETQEKIDEWTSGPTTCEKMDSVIGCRANCPFADKCSSPITLGFSQQAESVAEETVTEDDEIDMTNVGETIEGGIPYWPKEVQMERVGVVTS